MLGTKLYVLRKQVSSTLGNLLKPAGRLLQPLGTLPRWLTTGAWIVGLVLLCWMCFGCTQTRIVRPPLPPQAEPREVPSFQGQTYRDVILYVIELKETAQASEADKAAIRRVYGQ